MIPMVKTETNGRIGSCEVTISVEGDETLANLIYADLVGRADEIKQIVDEDTRPENTTAPTAADWHGYHSGKYSTPTSEDK